MAPRTRRIVFGRINRREESLGMQSFADDMSALAESHLTTHTVRGTSARPMRTWTAADMAVTADGDFLTGVLGYTEPQQQVTFDDEAFSWMKAQVEDSETASDQTIAPFAVDLRENNRWVAFATTRRVPPYSFRHGFELVLNEAVGQLGLMPTSWEVDLVTSKAMIRQWLTQNPRVHNLIRTIKFSNPGKDLDEDRQEMRRLGARRKTEEFEAGRSRVLDTGSEQFLEKLEGTETGDLEIKMQARGSHGVADANFNSRNNVDEHRVEDFGTDLQQGIDIVLSALQEYVASKEPPAQGKLTDEL